MLCNPRIYTDASGDNHSVRTWWEAATAASPLVIRPPVGRPTQRCWQTRPVLLPLEEMVGGRLLPACDYAMERSWMVVCGG